MTAPTAFPVFGAPFVNPETGVVSQEWRAFLNAVSALTNSATGAEPQAWTPTDASGAGLALTINDALWVKFGHPTFLLADVTWPVTADASDATLGGIPRSPWAASGFAAGGGAPSYSDYGSPLTISLLPGTGYIQFYSVAGAALTNANLSGKRVAFTIPCFLEF